MKAILKKLLNKYGYTVTANDDTVISKYEKSFKDIYKACKPYTMTSLARMYTLYKSVEYIAKNNIQGDLIECGVWRGGSSMLIAKSLLHFGLSDRKIYLFDTFEGMSAPTSNDIDSKGKDAASMMNTEKKNNAWDVWCYSEIEDVKNNMRKTAYPENNIEYIKGKVEDTLPDFKKSEKISLLRLDTDWYESTLSEMNHLYPLVEKKGIIIFDDYDYWQGSKKAVDEYFNKHNLSPLLIKIDEQARLIVNA